MESGKTCIVGKSDGATELKVRGGTRGEETGVDEGEERRRKEEKGGERMTTGRLGYECNGKE